MVRNDFNGTAVPALGLGMMRLPCVDGKYECIDEKAVETMVDHALDNGVNYFDTAWMYHHGHSESVAGRVLKRHRRDSFLIASKFPGLISERVPLVKETFQTQLERCQCGYFDFYLLHNVYENTLGTYLDNEKNGIVSYLLEEKAAGRIRNFGFSCHGSLEVMRKFLDRYADIMEFCQLQINYLDWHLQDACAKMELMREYNMPVWVMEPLRGGKLAAWPEECDRSELQKLHPEYSAVEWAFRFLQSLPEVKVVLSGMSNMEQLTENIRIFSENKPLDEQEFQALTGFSRRLIDRIGVPCTACGYCKEKCPKNLDIPKLLSLYNDSRVSNGGWIPKVAVENLPEAQRPAACIGCRSCEKLCPQGIKIADALKDFTGLLNKDK